MKLIAVALVIAAGPAAAQDHAHCHAAPSPSPTQRDAVDHRHDQTTGVPHEGSEHHFLLAPDGGEIRLEATDAVDTLTRDGSARTCAPSPRPSPPATSRCPAASTTGRPPASVS